MSDVATQFLAWWGAIIATAVLLWDVHKWWRTGPQIRMMAQGNMRAMGDPELEGRPLIIVHATNIGDRATTLESMWLDWYENWWRYYIRRKTDRHYLIKNPGRERSFPYRLEVGERWDGIADQSGEIADHAKEGYWVCNLSHACSKCPVKARIRFAKDAG